ncbi:MAG TPA: hypothetical protein V6C81_30720 [Planktothrix sp.]|jgi:hypothetical protein
MRSAFSTALSAMGVVAACYLITVATWVQVLLLFLAASLGWCGFVILNRGDKIRTPDIVIMRQPPQPAVPERTNSAEAARPAHIVHKAAAPRQFPIHKLGGRSLPLAQPGN